jgi:hypothetical protein
VRTSDVPLQVGQVWKTVRLSPGPTRWRVSSRSPKFEIRPTLIRAPVHLEGFAELALDDAAMLVVHHVDEVADDQATEVAEAQLSDDLLDGIQVGLEGGLLQCRARLELAELTSIATSASVCSTTIEPPPGSSTRGW